MKTLQLVIEKSDATVESLRKKRLTEKHFHTLLLYDMTVLKPNGEFLLKYVRNQLTEAECNRTFDRLKKVGRRAGSSNRPAVKHAIEGLEGVLGFSDRNHLFRNCRMTELTRQYLEEYISVLPFARRINELYRHHVPERYAAQAAAVNRTHPEWIIPGTVFSSWTLNLSVDTTAHTDDGDLPEGCSVLTVTWRGEPKGCYLVFPKYMVAVQMRTGDVLFMDSHAMHGNTRFTGEKGTFERMAHVFYYRTGMQKCGTLAEENGKIA
jgi:hypothetical protein